MFGILEFGAKGLELAVARESRWLSKGLKSADCHPLGPDVLLGVLIGDVLIR